MMTSRRVATLRSLGPIARIDGVIAVLIVAFGFWRGWTTPAQYGLAFLLAGGAILAFGVLSLRSQKLLDDGGRPLAEQQRLYGTRATLRHHNHLDLPQARTMMGTLGAASLPLLAL
jgi:hypothetical protein